MPQTSAFRKFIFNWVSSQQCLVFVDFLSCLDSFSAVERLRWFSEFFQLAEVWLQSITSITHGCPVSGIFGSLDSADADISADTDMSSLASDNSLNDIDDADDADDDEPEMQKPPLR